MATTPFWQVATRVPVQFVAVFVIDDEAPFARLGMVYPLVRYPKHGIFPAFTAEGNDTPVPHMTRTAPWAPD